MDKINAGVIGLGVGEHHVEGYLDHPACGTVTVCDLDAGRVERVRERFPSVRSAGAAEDILDDPAIGVVSIASFDDHHYRQARGAIERGKHAFVEKPLCLKEEEARELRALLARKPGLLLSSNLPLRACPRFRRLREMIRDGTMGRLFSVEGDYDYGRLGKLTEGWRGRIPGYSVVLGGAIHMVDLLLWLTGERVVETTGMANRIATADTGLGFDDFAVNLLRFESGLIGKVAANFGCVRPHFHHLAVFGTSSTFLNGEERGLLFTSREAGPAPVAEAYPGYRKSDLARGFMDAVATGGEPGVTAEDVFRTMSVCFAMEEALRRPGPARVAYL